MYVQTELCRKVIRLYQDMAVSWLLDKTSWEYLLSVLLHHTWKLLTAKDSTLACALANLILKVKEPPRGNLVYTCLHTCNNLFGYRVYSYHANACPPPPLIVDAAGMFLAGIHGDGCESLTLGQAVTSPPCTHSLEGGRHAVEGELMNDRHVAVMLGCHVTCADSYGFRDRSSCPCCVWFGPERVAPG